MKGEQRTLVQTHAAGAEVVARPASPWIATELGRSVGLSRAAFTRRFTAGVGQPPMTYLKRWRLNQAARLLRQTDAPLSSIAQQVGYSTEFVFGAAFRKEYATSPGRFREAARSITPSVRPSPDLAQD